MSDEEMSETPPISPSRWPGTPTSPFRWSDPSTQAMLRHFLSTNQISLETYQSSEQMMCSPSGVASPADLRPLSPLWYFPEENGFKSAGNYKAYGAQEASYSTTRFEYQVYLSFRGEDTYKTFTDHLYIALTCRGFRTFKDADDCTMGDNISFELQKAIQESTVSIVVVSKNYAFSDWCLDQLVMILKCRRTSRHTVLPVFYDVNPSQVRKQCGSFRKAFERHEKRFETEIGERKNEWKDKVKGWRAALVELADLSEVVFNNDEPESATIKALTHALVQQLSIQDTQLNNPSYEEKREEFVKNWAEAFAPFREHPEIDMKDMEHIETSQMVNACESQIAVASSGKHDVTETRKCKRGTFKISMEHTETSQAIYAPENQNAVAFSRMQDLIAIQHAEISQAIYDSESQNAVTFSGEQDPISIEHPQNSQAVYDSESPNVVTFSAEQDPISIGHNQKSQAVFASESQNAVTFSGEQDPIFIEHPQNSQAVYDSESPNVVTFSREKDLISIEHTQKSQVVYASESQNVVAFSGKQVLISFKHTETSQAMHARESQNAVVFSGKQDRRKSLKPKCGISDTTISLDVLKQYFHMKLTDAAKSLNVSRSTLKRICRQHNIPWWPNHKRHMLNHVTGFVEGATSAPPAEGLSLHPPDPIELHQQDSLTALSNFTCEIQEAENISPACNTSSSDHRQAKLVGASVSRHQEFHEQTRKKRRPIDSSFESNPLNLPSLDLDSKQTMVTHAHEIPHVKTKLDAGTVTMKATYGKYMIKFQFSSTSGIDDLKQEVATRLMLEIDSFDIKYLDDEHDWISIRCEADLKLCMDTASSPGNNTTIKLQVHKIKRQLKRKR